MFVLTFRNLCPYHCKPSNRFLRVIKVVEVGTAVGELLAETNMDHLFEQNSGLL